MNNKKIEILIKAKDDASETLRRVGGSVDTADRSVGGFSSSLSKLKNLALGLGLAGLGYKFVSFAKDAVMAAGDYEQALNMFQAVSGATAREMAVVAERAQELGNDIALPGVSAKDAALSMLELSKAGLSVNDTLSASKGVMALAKAGQLDTAAAAEIAANALNAFKMKGDEATRVADILAAAANASSADVGDLAYGLQMASASAAAMKVPLDETVGLLAALSNNGLKGSDAGTSLKTMFMSLTPTTKKAKEAMRELNLDFFDAKGNFVGMREVVKQLEKGTAKLTDEQKAYYLETIFGSDAVRAANILLKEGVAGYDKMTTAVNRAGAATELAAAQNKGFKGSLDALGSSIDTLGITVGGKVLPKLTGFVDHLTRGVNAVTDSLSDMGGEITETTRKSDTFSERIAVNRHEMGLLELAHSRLSYAKQDVSRAEERLQAVEAQAPALQKAVASARELVGQRQRELNDAIQQYGPKSDEAWQATLRLEEAQGRLNGQLRESANNTLTVTTAKGRLRDANWELADATSSLNDLSMGLANKTLPGLVRSMQGVEVQAVRSAGQIQGALNVTEGAQFRLNGKIGELQSTSSQVTQKIMGNFGQIQSEANTVIQKLNQMPAQSGGLRVTHRAKGGPVTAGQAYAVGDNPDGSWNRTTELFVPRQSGTIIPANEVQRALKHDGNKGVTINQTNNIFNQVDLDLANREMGWRLASA